MEEGKERMSGSRNNLIIAATIALLMLGLTSCAKKASPRAQAAVDPTPTPTSVPPVSPITSSGVRTRFGSKAVGGGVTAFISVGQPSTEHVQQGTQVYSVGADVRRVGN